MTTFNALHLARGWLSVALASADDAARPMLDRTVFIERHTSGVRLVATDSYLLLRSWVPQIDRQDDPEPDLDEAPVATAVAVDVHGRARGFLAHLLKLATAKGADQRPPIEVELGLGVVAEVGADEDAAISFEGLEARWVTLDHLGVERLRLSVFEGDFPNWRPFFDVTRQSTDSIALHPDRLGQVAKLATIQPGRAIRWRFCGIDAPALIEVDGGEPAVAGLVMPVRVAWEAAPEAEAA